MVDHLGLEPGMLWVRIPLELLMLVAAKTATFAIEDVRSKYLMVGRVEYTIRDLWKVAGYWFAGLHC